MTFSFETAAAQGAVIKVIGVGGGGGNASGSGAWFTGGGGGSSYATNPRFTLTANNQGVNCAPGFLAITIGNDLTQVPGLLRPCGATADTTPPVISTQTVSADGRTVTLDLVDLRPTWGMEVRYDLKSRDGTPVRGVLHNTIHKLAPDK